jgi:hypothetical protein
VDSFSPLLAYKIAYRKYTVRRRALGKWVLGVNLIRAIPLFFSVFLNVLQRVSLNECQIEKGHVRSHFTSIRLPWKILC